MEQSNEEMTIEELKYRLEEEKVSNLTVSELKDIIRQIIKEEVPILTTINHYPEKEFTDNYRIYYDTKTTPYLKLNMFPCEADGGVGICEASDIIK